MKICHVITTLVYGGAEKLLVNTANIHAENHQVDIVYLKGTPDVVPQLSSSINIHFIPLPSALNSLPTLLQQLHPDIVHTHLGHADFLGLWASRNLKVKHFCTMHNIWFKYDWRDRLYFWGYRYLFDKVVPDCQVISISRSVSEHVIRRLAVSENRVITVYNAVPDVENFRSKAELRAQLGIPTIDFVILFVGRLRIQKSVDTLLLATAHLQDRIRNLRVLIVGEGKGYEEENLKQWSRKLGLDPIVQFCGTTQHPEQYFAAADLFVLPSVFEGLGLVILEAFRAALPVIATGIEGPKEIIRHAENGMLFTPKNVDQLVDIALQLYNDEKLRSYLGANGRRDFETLYSMQKYADILETLYATK
jgi:glycosyltransferase involved in cell wall biosynthesis